MLHVGNVHQEIQLRNVELLMQRLSLGKVGDRMKAINQ